MQYIQDITRLIYEYNLEIERFLTKNKLGSVGFTPPDYLCSFIRSSTCFAIQSMNLVKLKKKSIFHYEFV